MEPPSAPASSAPPVSLGLAIASLVLGIFSFVLSFLVIGAVLGVIGVILGFMHFAKKRKSTAMAKWGLALSILGIIAGIAFAAVYYSAYQHLQKIMADRSTNTQADFAKWEGVKAPDISITTLDGKTIKLSDLKGKRVVLDFWATWCPPCREEIPHFIQLYNQTSRSNLVIIGISQEDANTLRNFVKKNGINYPIVSANNFPPPYSDIQFIPTTFFIDRQGIIQTVDVGYHDFDDLKSNATAPDFQGAAKSAPANTTTTSTNAP